MSGPEAARRGLVIRPEGAREGLVIHPYGDRGLLVETGDLDTAHRVHEAVRAAVARADRGVPDRTVPDRTVAERASQDGAGGDDPIWARVEEVVPGAATVLVTLDAEAPPGEPGARGRSHEPPGASGAADLARLAAALRRLDLPPPRARAEATLRIPVRYDGPDLDEVAGLCGLSREEVVRRHAAGRYVVAYLGFSPGFGYLSGLDPALRVPRRDTPRTGVPAGAVAIAGPYTAVYPSASPGGWRLIGRTEVPLWDPTRDPPALLRPAAAVRFVPVP